MITQVEITNDYSDSEMSLEKREQISIAGKQVWSKETYKKTTIRYMISVVHSVFTCMKIQTVGLEQRKLHLSQVHADSAP